MNNSDLLKISQLMKGAASYSSVVDKYDKERQRAGSRFIENATTPQATRLGATRGALLGGLAGFHAKNVADAFQGVEYQSLGKNLKTLGSHAGVGALIGAAGGAGGMALSKYLSGHKKSKKK